MSVRSKRLGVVHSPFAASYARRRELYERYVCIYCLSSASNSMDVPDATSDHSRTNYALANSILNPLPLVSHALAAYASDPNR